MCVGEETYILVYRPQENEDLYLDLVEEPCTSAYYSEIMGLQLDMESMDVPLTLSPF